MLSVLVEGTLTAAPTLRTSSKGSTYATARMRAAGEDGEAVWCSLIAFDAGAVEPLSSLAVGDSLAVAGHAALSTWTKDGEHRAGLRVTVARVLTGKRRASAGNGDPPTRTPDC